ncbi:hypothetical protein CP09DC78_1154, partial [Chlamydia psittaci 09DC78]
MKKEISSVKTGKKLS